MRKGNCILWYQFNVPKLNNNKPFSNKTFILISVIIRLFKKLTLSFLTFLAKIFSFAAKYNITSFQHERRRNKKNDKSWLHFYHCIGLSKWMILKKKTFDPDLEKLVSTRKGEVLRRS